MPERLMNRRTTTTSTTRGGSRGCLRQATETNDSFLLLTEEEGARKRCDGIGWLFRFFSSFPRLVFVAMEIPERGAQSSFLSFFFSSLSESAVYHSHFLGLYVVRTCPKVPRITNLFSGKIPPRITKLADIEPRR